MFAVDFEFFPEEASTHHYYILTISYHYHYHYHYSTPTQFEQVDYCHHSAKPSRFTFALTLTTFLTRYMLH